MRLALLPTVLLLAPILVGCTPILSEDVPIGDWYVNYQVFDEVDSVRVRAEFRVRTALGDVIRLSAGDTITVNGTVLVYDGLVVPHYAGTVDFATEYAFVFTRPDVGAFTSTASLPGAVTITAPASGATVSQQTGFTVTWDDGDTTSDGSYDVFVDTTTGTCDVFAVESAPSATTVTFSQANFIAAGETEPPCGNSTLNGTLTVRSYKAGALDPIFRGLIRGVTDTSQSIVLSP